MLVWGTRGPRFKSVYPDVATEIGIGWYGKFNLAEPITSDRAARALSLLMQTGQTDGAHHKAWTIDQAVGILAGDEYEGLVAAHVNEGFSWSEGKE